MTAHVQQNQTYHCLWHNSKSKLLIDNAGSSFREISLVRHETATTETARTTELVHPLGPLGVEMAVGLLILGFENTYGILADEKRGGGGGGGNKRQMNDERGSVNYFGMTSLDMLCPFKFVSTN